MPARKMWIKKDDKKPALPKTIFQFKIALRYIKPVIWRQIQCADVTLDKLHEHIQTAMGWTNSHLHEFQIGKVRYGDPQLLGGDFGDDSFEDSTNISLSALLSKRKKGFKFLYVYDFGDNWEHDIVFEGEVPVQPKACYPICIDGARACPPEDCGSVPGYFDLLEALGDPKHADHEEFTEMFPQFKPDTFSVDKASKQMRQGVIDWR